jgi:hypothetical protein
MAGTEDGFDQLCVAPGRATYPGPEQLLTHDCGTMGDWAGSLILNLAEGTAAGLHVVGFLDHVGVAVSSASLLKAMAALGLTPAPRPEADEDGDGFEARRRRPEDYADRQPLSYREDFLGIPVPMPVAAAGRSKAIYKASTERVLCVKVGRGLTAGGSEPQQSL